MTDINEIQEEVKLDEEGHDIPISKKNGDPYLYKPDPAKDDEVPCTITVLGNDAKKVKAARDSIQRKLLRGRRVKLEPKDLRSNRVAIAAAAITGWKGWTAAGKDFPCTPENIITLLQSTHILEQVEEGINEHSDFSPTALSN